MNTLARFLGLVLLVLLPADLSAGPQVDDSAPQEKAREENKTDAAETDEAEAGDKEEEGEESKEGEEEKEDKEKDILSSGTFSALKFRGIGPALTSGRVGDLAVDPDDPSTIYAAISSGGVWKSVNKGTTWKSIFDGQGSYSIGCITLDPTNSSVVWVGSGENNSQRSVSFGDGVYKSLDGGKSWKHMGLKESEHIGMIAVHPADPDIVYVAAQGPLWRSGGDRGLYRTDDGGKNWDKVLEISDDTGVNEVHIDPRNPDVLYASSYQRRRHVWTLINGGPESAIYKSTDGGDNWRKVTNGLPGGDKGRIGMDIAPADPDVIYAIVEAAGGKGGIYRSTDRGENWSKRSSRMTSSPQYYNELVCDPKDVDRLYSLDTRLAVTEDGGKTWSNVPGSGRHVDDHALWIDPDDTDHLIVGCDGGIYLTWDRGASWSYVENLPITQFYRVAVDNSKPFYFVYGGTQDNNTLGGPSRTISPAGIANEDWFVTVGGDGFEPAIDPRDPNIVYSQWQHGGLVRYDRKSGEQVDIKPKEAPGEPPLKWNWDSPLIISPHLNTRLYFGANILYRSDDRGDSWRAVSGDLTRGIDRNQLEVMGKIQNVEAVSKNRSTSIFGNTIALTESPLVEGRLYVGTDDGLIHATSDGGANWDTFDTFPGIPEMTYVSELEASVHDADTVFAAFDNHKNGDFKPYLLKSTDRGQSWTSIAGDLPERNIVYTMAEDHVNPDLLFVGTEFGVYFTLDSGARWIRLKSGLPPIAVKDMEIQRRENDLVLATFGRGFYILDDYSPLREVSRERLEQPATLFPVKDALQYVETSRLGGRGRGSQGATFYTAPNPSYGAVFTYHLKDKLKTRKDLRKEAEKEAKKNKEPTPYPTIEELRAESEEVRPSTLLTVWDEDGNVVRRLGSSASKGMRRVTWDLRHHDLSPASARTRGGDEEEEEDRPRRGGRGPMVVPGRYGVTLSKVVDGRITQLAGPEWFEVVPLNLATLGARDRREVLAFQMKVQRLQGAVRGATSVAGEASTRIGALKGAIDKTPLADSTHMERALELEARLRVIRTALSGDSVLRSQQEPVPLSISSRVGSILGNQLRTTNPPTQTERDAYRFAGEEFEGVLARLRTLMEVDLAQLERDLEAAGAPWTPGRIPTWELED